MQRYIIIGTGVAGIEAARAIRSQDPEGEILLIGDEKQGFYSRPGIAYFLSKEVPEKLLFPFSENDFSQLRVQRLLAQVASIHPQEHHIALQDGSSYAYSKLLIATGASAAPSNAPGVDLQGVVKLDNLDDAHQIIKAAKKARKAVVVGGGITALEIVEGLLARRVQPHFFLRKDRYWGGVLDEIESRIVEHRLIEEGVKIHYHTELKEILGKRGRVVGVRTQEDQVIPCQMVAFAIGIRPRISLAQAANLQTDRGILVNEYLQTDAPDIYAAGDVAQVHDPLSGKHLIDSLWGPARAQGRAAGLNMAGIPTPYIKDAPFNVTRLAGLTTTIIGMVGQSQNGASPEIVRGDTEAWQQIPDAIASQSNFDVNRLRVMIGEQHFLGAIVMGDQTLSKPLQHLIVQQVDISPIRDQLLQPNAPIADLVTNFWTQWSTQHAA